MTYEFYTDVEIDINDVINDMTAKDRRELFNELRERVLNDMDEEWEEILKDVPSHDPKKLAEEIMRDLPPFEFKRVLIDALGIPSYYADEALRNALEPIITAR